MKKEKEKEQQLKRTTTPLFIKIMLPKCLDNHSARVTVFQARSCAITNSSSLNRSHLQEPFLKKKKKKKKEEKIQNFMKK